MTWRWIAIGFAAIATLVVLAVVPFVLFGVPPSANAFGDSFGFLNAFSSSVALVGLVVAILIQSHQLRLQQKELDDTQRLQMLTARMSALTSLIPVLPQYRATVEDGEVTDTSGGLTKEAAQLEVEFLLDWTAKRASIYVLGEGAPTWQEACELLERKVGDLLYSENADLNESKWSVGGAMLRAHHIEQMDRYPNGIREIARTLYSLLFLAHHDLFAQGSLDPQIQTQIQSAYDELTKLQHRINR